MRAIGFAGLVLVACLAASVSAQAVFDLGVYHTNAELLDGFEKYNAMCPDISTVVTIGTSVGGLNFYAFRISGASSSDGNQPEFLVAAGGSGKEPIGKEVSFGLIDHLCSGYGVDPGVTALVDSAEFFIVPTFNPDVIGTGDGSDGFETNLNGVNLYTHFPNPVNMDDDGDFREREIYNMMGFMDSRRFAYAVDIRSGARRVSYPFDAAADASNTPTYDDTLFQNLANHARSADASIEIMNGAEGGPEYGTMKDYNYQFLGGLQLTLWDNEVALAPEMDLQGIIDRNVDVLVSLFSSATTGAKGQVVDARNGNPTGSQVRISFPDSDAFTVFPDVFGKYHRLLNPGSYAVTITCNNFKTLETTIAVNGLGQWDVNDFEMEYEPYDPNITVIGQDGLQNTGKGLVVIFVVAGCLVLVTIAMLVAWKTDRFRYRSTLSDGPVNALDDMSSTASDDQVARRRGDEESGSSSHGGQHARRDSRASADDDDADKSGGDGNASAPKKTAASAVAAGSSGNRSRGASLASASGRRGTTDDDDEDPIQARY